MLRRTYISLLFLCTIFLILLPANGQQSFSLNSRYQKRNVEVNGRTYTIDSLPVMIPTAYPLLDTISIEDQPGIPGHPVLCNFKPDSAYTLYPACCGSVDITPAWRYNSDSLSYWYEEEQYERIQQLMLDNPFITFRLRHGHKKDSIYAWYEDYACFPSFKLLDKKGWKYGVPVKCFYWTNISPLVFFTSPANYTLLANKDGFITDVYPDEARELGNIYIRIFDDEYLTVIYAARSEKISVRLER